MSIKGPVKLVPQAKRGMDDEQLAELRKMLDSVWEAAERGEIDGFSFQATSKKEEFSGVVVNGDVDISAFLGHIHGHYLHLWTVLRKGDYDKYARDS